MAFETNRGAALTGNYIGVGIFAMFNLACLYIDMSASVCIYSQYVAARMRALSTWLNLRRRVYAHTITYFYVYLDVFFLV